MRVENLRNSFIGLAFVSVGFVCGCNFENPPLNDVSGELRYNGKPLPNMILNFMPTEGRPSQALTDAEGKFPHVVFSETRNGLMTGEYTVFLGFNPTEPPKIPGEPPEVPEELHAVLNKYGNYLQPKLKVTIEAGQKTLLLELKDD
jgi:hypothetical protein